jgi:hypothetical protein
MAAVKLRRWRAVIVKGTNSAPRPAVRIGGFLFKGQHTSYVKTVSSPSPRSPKSNSESKQTCTGCVQATTIDEAVVDEQNEAHDPVNTIFARFVTVRTQRLLRSNSALVTSVLYRNVTDPGKLRSTDLPRAMLTDSSATDTAASKLAATTRLQWDQGGA